MSASSNAVPDSVFDTQTGVAAAIPPTRVLHWSIRRELWENRSIYVAPLIVAGVFLFGFMISTAGLPHKIRMLSALAPGKQRDAVVMPYDFAAGILMLTQILVGVFYSLDALHGERRDRSILFWKSLPVSDLTTVLSKATIPVVILPLLTGVVTVAVYVIMYLFSSAVVAGSGLSVDAMWAQLSLAQMSIGVIYHLVTVHGLWHAPIYGWLMLVSGWARRAAFLWAALPVIAIMALEKLVFNSSHFAALMCNRFAGGAEAMPMATGRMPIDAGTHLTPGHFLLSPGLWLGLAVLAGFLLAAARMRRYRGPI